MKNTVEEQKIDVFSEQSYNRLPNAISALEELCKELNGVPNPGIRPMSPGYWQIIKTRLNEILNELILSRQEAKERRLQKKQKIKEKEELEIEKDELLKKYGVK